MLLLGIMLVLFIGAAAILCGMGIMIMGIMYIIRGLQAMKETFGGNTEVEEVETSDEGSDEEENEESEDDGSEDEEENG